MRVSARRAIAIAAAALLGLAGATLIACSSDPEASPKDRAGVLVFSKTRGFPHDSIPAGIAAIRSLGRANGFSVSATEDAATFTRKRLRRYDAVVFLNTTGDVLAPRQQA
ncbi:MAG: ThuA domain-containing protein, partial [Solirubrobacterales bacterium]